SEWGEKGGTGAGGGPPPFTRQRPQVRNLSRPPAKTPPRLTRPGRLPEDLPEDHGLGRLRTLASLAGPEPPPSQRTVVPWRRRGGGGGASLKHPPTPGKPTPGDLFR